MNVVAAHLLRCDGCGAQGIAVDGQNVHDTLNCRCCGPDHTHAAEDGSTPEGSACRSITLLGNAVVVPAVGGDA